MGNATSHLCASYLSYANMGYIWRDMNREERYELIRDLCEGIEILPMDAKQLYAGLSRPVKDYKEFCDIPFMSSHDFLVSFLKQQQ